MNPSLLDRVTQLAPLAVLAFVLHRSEAERGKMLRALAEDRESFRNERRELINRVQFPTRMPTAHVPTRPADRNGFSPAEQERARFAQVGLAAPALPGDADDVPGAE